MTIHKSNSMLVQKNKYYKKKVITILNKLKVEDFRIKIGVNEWRIILKCKEDSEINHKIETKKRVITFQIMWRWNEYTMFGTFAKH